MNNIISKAISDPVANALKDLYVGVVIIGETLTDFLIFTNKNTRDEWVKGYVPSLSAYNPALAANRHVVTTEQCRLLFGSKSEEDILQIIGRANPVDNDATVRIVHFDHEHHAALDLLREYSIAAYTYDENNVDIFFFPDEVSRNDWLEGNDMLNGEELTTWHDQTCPVTPEHCIRFFENMTADEIKEAIDNAELHDTFAGISRIHFYVDKSDLIADALIYSKFQEYYFATYTTECPNIAFFKDEQARNDWVNANPHERAAINEILDHLWLVRPGKILAALINAIPDYDGVCWLKLDKED